MRLNRLDHTTMLRLNGPFTASNASSKLDTLLNVNLQHPTANKTLDSCLFLWDDENNAACTKSMPIAAASYELCDSKKSCSGQDHPRSVSWHMLILGCHMNTRLHTLDVKGVLTGLVAASCFFSSVSEWNASASAFLREVAAAVTTSHVHGITWASHWRNTCHLRAISG